MFWMAVGTSRALFPGCAACLNGRLTVGRNLFVKTIYRSLSWMALAALIFGASGPLLAQQTLTVSPTPLNFSAQAGSTAAQSQTCRLPVRAPTAPG